MRSLISIANAGLLRRFQRPQVNQTRGDRAAAQATTGASANYFSRVRRAVAVGRWAGRFVLQGDGADLRQAVSYRARRLFADAGPRADSLAVLGRYDHRRMRHFRFGARANSTSEIALFLARLSFSLSQCTRLSA